MNVLLFWRLIEECNGKGVLIKVPNTIAKEWDDFGNLRLIYRMNVGVKLLCVSDARLNEDDRYALGSRDWFP